MCFVISLNNIFLDKSLQTREIKAKINKWDYIKLESFCTGKDTTNKMKRKPTECKKIFANDTSYKGLIYKYTKNTRPTKYGQRTWNRHYSKDDIQMANRYMERCSTWPVARETQITATMRNHLTHVIMAIIKKTTEKSTDKNMGKRNLSALLLGM